jgi:hypothetical protein
MNDELRKLVEQRCAPEDVMNEMWFIIFCQQFAHLILTLAECLE